MVTIETLGELTGQPHANVFPGSEPKTIKLTLAAGEAVPAHSHPGRDVVFHVLEGTIELRLGEQTHTVGAGDVARFAGERDVAPRAVDDSVVLIVLAERIGRRTT